MKEVKKGELLLEFYKVTCEIGQGVNGIVYGATDLRDDRKVAVKNYTRGRGPLSGGLVELSNTLQVRHPNIVQCLDFYYGGEGDTYLVYEFIEGGNLRERMETAPAPWSRDDVRNLIRQILLALRCIHRNRMIHGDIKPENILLTQTGDGPLQVKLTDLGTATYVPATWVKDRQPKGSPAYMAPERFYDKYTFNADIYALGILLYELLTGDLPFLGGVSQIAAGHLREVPSFEAITDSRWKAFLNGLMEKDPAVRIQSADEALRLLDLSVSDASAPELFTDRERGSVQTPGTAGEDTSRPPLPLTEYEQVKSFTLPHRPHQIFAIGSTQNPGILCSQNNFLTWYQGKTGSPQSIFLPAHGATIVAGRQGEFFYTGPGGVFRWRIDFPEGELIFPYRHHIATLASGSSMERLSCADTRHLHFFFDGREYAAHNLESGGITVGLFQLADGRTLLLEGAAPTRLTVYNASAEVIKREKLPGCLINASPFPEVQAVFLEQGENHPHRSSGQLRLLRYIQDTPTWFDLPGMTSHFKFLRSGFLWIDSNDRVQFLDLQGTVHLLARTNEEYQDFAFSDDALFYYATRQQEGEASRVTFFQRKEQK